MRRSADVVIRMQQNSENIRLLYPDQVDWDAWRSQKPDVPYSEAVVSFLDELSSALLHDKRAKSYPDVMTFAFFCRKANVMRCKNQTSIEGLRLGRGVLFHVAPSNVPINFAFSLVAGLLAGNRNVVRVSSKEFPQVALVVDHLKSFSDTNRWPSVLQRIALVQYDRGDQATSFFSSFCQVRIIWGGDATINQIRKSQIPARSFDVTFADRYSIAAFNANEMSDESLSSLASSFYNDTYLFDQNACSAPHLVVWLGSAKNIETVRPIFWKTLHDIVKEKYNFQPVMSVDKLAAFYRQAVSMPMKRVETEDNLLVRVRLDNLSESIEDYKCTGGYFSEYIADNLDEVAKIVNNKYQTLAYYGFKKEDLEEFVSRNQLLGIDRIVPIGATTDFSFVWDGYDLIRTLSRVITIK